MFLASLSSIFLSLKWKGAPPVRTYTRAHTHPELCYSDVMVATVPVGCWRGGPCVAETRVGVTEVGVGGERATSAPSAGPTVPIVTSDPSRPRLGLSVGSNL